MDNNNGNPEEVIVYSYKFIFKDKPERVFKVRIDKKTLNLALTQRESYPEWTKLTASKCSNCPLDEKEHEFCPIAVNLIDLIDFFKDSVSYEEVDILIEAESRNYTKHAALQNGISSLIGIYMAASGCPVMDKLKPMACYHLPFGLHPGLRRGRALESIWFMYYKWSG